MWSSAAIAAKFGLHSTTPLTLATIRFLIAGTVLLLFVYLLNQKYPWPKKEEWIPLLFLGLLNTTIYLGASFWAFQFVSAGLFNLFVASNPFFVAFLSFIWLKRKTFVKEWIGMLIAGSGLIIATIPSLLNSYATVSGLIVLTIGMLSMAIGSVYYKKINLDLPNIVINTWQVIIGGFLLLPITILLEGKTSFFSFDMYLIGSLLWLIFVISIGAMLLWFYLLKQDAVTANNWLFITPIFGYILANLLLNEPITFYDITATLLVVLGLFISGNIVLPTRNDLKKMMLKEKNM